MPQFSAPAALALTAELCPEIPFIIVSGEIHLNLAVSLMREGAWDYVQKNELVRLLPSIERAFRDVHARDAQKRSTLDLAVSESRYRRLFETAQDGILILDAGNGQILDVNPFLMDMLDYSKEQFLGKKLWEVGALKDVEASKAAFAKLQKETYIRYEDLPLEAKDGRQIAAEFVSNVYLVDNTRGIQCNIRDITARKHAEAALHELTAVLEQRVRDRTTQLEGLIEELKTFNYSVSHDLQAPLRHINAFTEQLEHEHAEKLDDAGLQLLHRIRASAQKMKPVIDRLLALARISRQDLRRQLTNLSAKVHQIAADLQAGDPGRVLKFDIAEDITTTADSQLMRIALENLLANAWKFTARQEHAHIEFGNAPQSDGRTDYFVRDNGAGFDMAYSGKLFTAFQRLHSEQEFPGTGIGLATVQRILQRHNGRIWAESAVGKGATFYFTL